jgi:hypothetical protein
MLPLPASAIIQDPAARKRKQMKAGKSFKDRKPLLLQGSASLTDDGRVKSLKKKETIMFGDVLQYKNIAPRKESDKEMDQKHSVSVLEKKAKKGWKRMEPMRAGEVAHLQRTYQMIDRRDSDRKRGSFIFFFFLSGRFLLFFSS